LERIGYKIESGRRLPDQTASEFWESYDQAQE
jgi:hypothetical protein